MYLTDKGAPQYTEEEVRKTLRSLKRYLDTGEGADRWEHNLRELAKNHGYTFEYVREKYKAFLNHQVVDLYKM